jgi:hypothetical protein
MLRLVYILGASHSGSTLLAKLLSVHPEACTAGELKAMNIGDPEYRCSCGSPIRLCSFWREVSRAMASRGVNGFDITEAATSVFEVRSHYARRLLAPLQRTAILESARDIALSFSRAWRAHLRETQRRNVALIASLQELTESKVVIDSSKMAVRLKYLLRNPELDVKIIWLVRDGRAVALTYIDEWNFADAADPALRGGGSGSRRASPRRSIADAARDWRGSNEAADCLTTRLPTSQWTQVKYEELCAQPEFTACRLFQFLGLSPRKVNLNSCSRSQHVIGNGMRFDVTSEIRLDERWRNHLSREDVGIFNTVAGKLNRQYGYV